MPRANYNVIATGPTAKITVTAAPTPTATAAATATATATATLATADSHSYVDSYSYVDSTATVYSYSCVYADSHSYVYADSYSYIYAYACYPEPDPDTNALCSGQLRASVSLRKWEPANEYRLQRVGGAAHLHNDGGCQLLPPDAADVLQ